LFTHALEVGNESCIARFCLGNALLERGDASNGLANLKRAAELDPSFPNVHGKLAYLEAGAGKFQEALSKYEQALKCRPDFPEALNNLAWLLATCPEAGVRDGKRAVVLAERACQLTGFQKTLYVGTLAAAYAEAGRFSEAVAAAERARANALAWGESGLAEKNSELLALYRVGQAYHEPAEQK
jgi:tetratricopeptide (TPR) repeat protein